MSRAARALAALAVAAVLQACGGGNWEEPEPLRPGVDCKARPELCA